MSNNIVEPTVVYPNGDKLYIATDGTLLLQLDTGYYFKRAYEPASGTHHQYVEIPENEFDG